MNAAGPSGQRSFWIATGSAAPYRTIPVIGHASEKADAVVLAGDVVALYFWGAALHSASFKFFEVGDNVNAFLRVVNFKIHLGARNQRAGIGQPTIQCCLIPS